MCYRRKRNGFEDYIFVGGIAVFAGFTNPVIATFLIAGILAYLYIKFSVAKAEKDARKERLRVIDENHIKERYWIEWRYLRDNEMRKLDFRAKEIMRQDRFDNFFQSIKTW